MKFEEYLRETNVSLASSLLEGLETESLEKKMRLLAALSVLIGEIFDNPEMVQSGIEALKSEESL